MIQRFTSISASYHPCLLHSSKCYCILIFMLNVRVCVCFRAYRGLQHAPCAWFRKDGVDHSSGGGVGAHLPLPHSAAGRPGLLEVRHWSTLTDSLAFSVSMNRWLQESHWLTDFLSHSLIDTRLIPTLIESWGVTQTDGFTLMPRS